MAFNTRRLPEPAQEEEQGEDVTEDKGSMWRALRQLKSLKELHLEVGGGVTIAAAIYYIICQAAEGCCFCTW
jgi:hypothetical protein